jgi:ABC-2 type transport system permease protein
VPSIVVAVLILYGTTKPVVENAAQSLFLLLTIRVVIVLVVLVIAVAQFRTEIEQDTLTYLSTRSVARPDIVLGKYLGTLAASLVFLVPAGIVPLLIAGLGGSPSPPTEVTGAILIITLLATLAYAGVDLFLGLVSRNALVIGLLYGFLWEELALLLPGDFPRLTLTYYLESYANGSVPSGPLSGSLTVVPAPLAAMAPVIVAVLFVTLTAYLFRFVESAPQRTSA